MYRQGCREYLGIRTAMLEFVTSCASASANDDSEWAAVVDQFLSQFEALTVQATKLR